MGVRVFARRGLGRLIRCEIDLMSDDRCPVRADQSTTEENHAKHRCASRKERRES